MTVPGTVHQEHTLNGVLLELALEMYNFPT